MLRNLDAILNSLSLYLSPIEESFVHRISLGRDYIIIISNYYSDRANLISPDITLWFFCRDINDRKQNYTDASALICYDLPPLRRPSLGRRKLVTRCNTCNCLRGCRGCLHSIISSRIIRARTWTNASHFRASVYQSWLDRSVEMDTS